MKFFSLLYDLLRHLGEDAKWRALIDYIGTTNLYIVLFAIIFAETGLVVTPFLPGDSLLFALGAIGTRDVGINLPLITTLLIIAAIIGDAVNYWIGFKLGPKVFSRDSDEEAPAQGTAGSDATEYFCPDCSKKVPQLEGFCPHCGHDLLEFKPAANAATQVGTGKVDYAGPRRKKTLFDKMLNKKHLLRAQEFYEKYGGKTIILARFVPIVRTFAPFVAGVGKMNYFKFAMYNVIGAILWVGICVGAGVLFGEMPFVKKNFELVIVGIVIVSVLPVVIEFIRAKRAAKTGGSAVVEATTIGKSEG